MATGKKGGKAQENQHLLGTYHVPETVPDNLQTVYYVVLATHLHTGALG